MAMKGSVSVLIHRKCRRFGHIMEQSGESDDEAVARCLVARSYGVLKDVIAVLAALFNANARSQFGKDVGEKLTITHQAEAEARAPALKYLFYFIAHPLRSHSFNRF